MLVGWRQPGASGLGRVDTVLEDGLPGLPLWKEPMPTFKVVATPCPTPLITGNNGNVYLLRETADGPRLQGWSSTGAFLQQFPPELAGVTAVTRDNTLWWAHFKGNSLGLSSYSAAGKVLLDWKLVPRPAKDAVLTLLYAGGWYGWLTSTDSLLCFDDTITLTSEATVLTADEKPGHERRRRRRRPAGEPVPGGGGEGAGGEGAGEVAL